MRKCDCDCEIGQHIDISGGVQSDCEIGQHIADPTDCRLFHHCAVSSAPKENILTLSLKCFNVFVDIKINTGENI